MLIGVPTEVVPGERRVALVPETVANMKKAGWNVLVQRGAGTAASFLDEAYEKAGATLAADAAELYGEADLIAKVQRPTDAELALMREGTTLLGFLAPLGDPQSVEKLAARKLTALSMDAIPRITRAQSMDALSSQSNIAGYKAVLLAAVALPNFFPMLTTAAGTIPPAKVLVLGAGVAGLQAIATARRLGAVVSGYDTRAVVKEQVQSARRDVPRVRSRRRRRRRRRLREGADARADREAARVHGRSTSAPPMSSSRRRAVPGRRAPILITEEAVKAHEAGQRHRRSRRRDRRQLRAHRARRGRREARRHDRRHEEPPIDDAVSREPALLAQRLRALAAPHQGRRADLRLERRDRERHHVDPRRNDHPRTDACRARRKGGKR